MKAIAVSMNNALQELLRGIEPAKANILLAICEKYSLDPVLRHAVLIAGNLYITRDGLLHVAHSSGQLDGIEIELGNDEQDGMWAECSVYRKDMSRPFRYRVYRAEYDTKKGAWLTHPRSMLIKVAEVMALRRAFPVGLAALEEMERTFSVEVVPEPEQDHGNATRSLSARDQVEQIKSQLKEHCEAISIDYDDVQRCWYQAREHGLNFGQFAKAVLKCRTADEYLALSMKYEPILVEERT